MARRKTAETTTAVDPSPPDKTGTPLGDAAPAVITESKLPAPVALKDFRITRFRPTEIAEVLKENFGSEKLDRFALTHIKLPSGGGLSWTVPTLEGPKPMEVVEGVILSHQKNRAYWRESFASTGGGSPPDCSSLDAEVGRGDPGGPCHACPFQEWGSAVDDKGEPSDGQACRLVRVIYLLRPASIMPSVIPIPPSSLKAFNAYSMMLTDENHTISSVVTKFGLAQDKNKKGILYSKVKLSVGKVLTKQEVDAWIVPMRRMIQGLTSVIDVRDFENAV